VLRGVEPHAAWIQRPAAEELRLSVAWAQEKTRPAPPPTLFQACRMGTVGNGRFRQGQPDPGQKAKYENQVGPGLVAIRLPVWPKSSAAEDLRTFFGPGATWPLRLIHSAGSSSIRADRLSACSRAGAGCLPRNWSPWIQRPVCARCGATCASSSRLSSRFPPCSRCGFRVSC